MAKKETVYDKAFAIYELKLISDNNKNKIRKFIKRHLENEYGKGCIWNNLSSTQKDTFLYITIRQGMLDNYVDISKHKKINATIDAHLKRTFLDSDKEVRKHNSIIEPIYENYFNDSDTEEEQEKKYKLLCKTIQNFNSHVPVQSFKEWLDYPLRPYDYIASYENELPTIAEEYIPTQSEVDHIVLQVLLKFLKEQMNLEINTHLIRECLYYLGNYDVNRYETLIDEYDPTLTLTKDEQEKIITANRQYFSYKKMLDNLSFT